MISIEIDTKPDTNWNKRLVESAFGTVYQSKERATQLETQGIQSYFLKFIDSKGDIVGQLLTSTRERFEGKKLKTQFLRSIPGLNQDSCEWSYGPIIFRSGYDSEIFSLVQDFLKSKNLRVKAWTHPLLPTNPKVLLKYFQLRNWGTFLINLDKSKDEVYKNFDKHSCQKNIERSIKRGVEVEELTETTLHEYYDLINKMRQDIGREKSDFDVFKTRWKQFKPLGYSGFLARKNGNLLGGLLFSYVSRHIIEIGVARSKEDTENNLYAQDLLKWKIIEWGIENNMKCYDLTGFNPEPISKKEEGIIRYKKKWGGTPHYYYRILNKPNLLTGKV